MRNRTTARTRTGERRLATGAVVATCCGNVFIIMALTAGSLMLAPAIGRDLGATQSDLQWFSDSYPVLLAALLLPAGAMLDRHGRRLGMAAGLAVMTLALLWSGLAGSIEVVVASRCLAGVGAAFVFPGTLATITAMLPAERRSAAVTGWTLSMVVGACSGVIVFPLIDQVGDWRLAFFVIAGCSVALLAATWLLVPETREERGVPVDPIGALISFAAIGAIALAVTEAPVEGWTSTFTLGVAAFGIAMTIAFVAWELRHPAPLLDVSLFADGRFGSASAQLFVSFFAHFAMFFLMIQYATYVCGYGAVRTSLWVVPPAIGFLLAPVSPWLARRVGRRNAMVLALAVVLVGASTGIVLTEAGGRSILVWFATATVLWAGMGLGLTPPTEMIIEAVPPEKQGVASAVNDLARELAAAFGIAFAGSAFNSAYRSYIGAHLDGVPAKFHDLMTDSPASALAALRATPRTTGATTRIQEAVVLGWQWGFGVIVVAVLLGIAVVLVRCPGRARETSGHAPAPLPSGIAD